MLHEGRGELHTVSGADIVRSHAAVRERATTSAVATIGAEAVLKLNVEPDPQPQVFAGLDRFLTCWTGRGPEADPALDPLGLGFQLKASPGGYLPHLAAWPRAGRRGRWRDTRPRPEAPSATTAWASRGRSRWSTRVWSRSSSWSPSRSASPAAPRDARDALRMVEHTYEYHGGFQLRTLRA